MRLFLCLFLVHLLFVVALWKDSAEHFVIEANNALSVILRLSLRRRLVPCLHFVLLNLDLLQRGKRLGDELRIVQVVVQFVLDLVHLQV